MLYDLETLIPKTGSDAEKLTEMITLSRQVAGYLKQNNNFQFSNE